MTWLKGSLALRKGLDLFIHSFTRTALMPRLPSPPEPARQRKMRTRYARGLSWGEVDPTLEVYQIQALFQPYSRLVLIRSIFGQMHVAQAKEGGSMD